MQKDMEQAHIRVQLFEIENRNKELLLELKNKEINEKSQKIDKLDKESKVIYENYSKQELAIQLLNKTKAIDALKLQEEKKNADHERKLRTQTTYALILMGILVMAVFYFFIQSRKANKLLFIKNEQISNQNKEIELQKVNLEITYNELQNKNDNIIASINYAKIIQNAILPSKDRLNELLPEHFIFYKPKDIVSGDFYWISEKKRNYFTCNSRLHWTWCTWCINVNVGC